MLPASVADPAVWYRADAGVSISGEIITQWEDQSGNGYHLTLSQGDPVLNTNALNGMPAVVLDGDDVLEADYTSEPATIFVIGKTVGDEITSQSWAGGRTSSQAVPNAWSFNATSTANYGRSFQRTVIAGSVPNAQAISPIGEVIFDQHYLQTGRLDAATGTVELITQGFPESTAGTGQPLTAIDKMAVGASYSGDNLTGFLDGDINEVLIYDRVLTDDEVSQVQSYLTRWFGGDPTQNNFMAASWVSDTDQNLYVLQSVDAHTFTGAYASHGPLGNDVVRDPSIMYDQTSGYWWVAYTTAHWSDPSDYIGLARSKDGVFWDNVTRIDTSSVTQGNPRSWAPEWVEDEDGWHLIAGLSSDGSATLEMYELHPTDEQFTTWSEPEKLTGLQPHVVDGMVTKIGDLYHIWYTDKTGVIKVNVHATAESLTGPYTLDPSLQGNWYPVAASVEGPYVVNIEDDHWRMYFDQPGPGTKLIPGAWTGLYIDSYDGMQTWGPPNQITSPAKRHLSIVNLELDGPRLEGDLNDDGFVGIEDLNVVLSNWNQNVEVGSWIFGDPTGDGFVGIEDLSVILGNWNTGTPPTIDAASIPEPGSHGMLLISALILSHRSRR